MDNQYNLSLEGKFNWIKPEIYTSYLQGDEAKLIYDSLEKNIRGEIGYDLKSKTIIGSTPFLSARVDSLIRPLGLRVANLKDLSRTEVINMIKGKYYTDVPVLVVRSHEDSNSKNLFLIKRIIEEVEKREGNIKFPFMIYGFDVKSWPEDKQGYGIDIIARDDFNVVSDERLSKKYNGGKFSSVDDLGLPLFERYGVRTFYSRNDGLSRVCLDGVVLSQGVDDGHLAGSYGDGGRVVVVSAEGTQKF